MSLTSSAASLLQPLIVNDLVDSAGSAQGIGYLPVLIILVLIIGAILNGVQQYFIQKVAESVARDARTQLVRKILRIPLDALEKYTKGDVLSRVINDTMLLRRCLTEGFVQSFVGVFTLIGAVIGMFFIDPLLLAISAVISLLAVVSVTMATSKVEKSSAQMQQAVGELSSDVSSVLEASSLVRTENAAGHQFKRLQQKVDNAWLKGIGVARLVALITPISAVAMQITFLVVLGVGGVRVANGIITVGNLVSFVMFLVMMIMPLGYIFGTMSNIAEASGGITRIQEILGIPDEYPEQLDTYHENRDIRSILLDNVSFKYGAEPEEGASPYLISGMTLSIAPGEKIAIVGPSGSGKSTLLRLIARLYEISGGNLLYSGTASSDISIPAVRAKIGLVQQESPLILGTLLDNVYISGRGTDSAAAHRILKDLGLEKVLERSGHGVDLNIGGSGTSLSGGEKQRLAIARVILKNPQVYLLDEFTSQLDGISEELVVSVLNNNAAPESTMIMVAHRMSTVVNADMIYVMDHGRIVAQGTHDILMEFSPLYRELVSNQLIH
ncbi:ABC transporter ATP-binding protein [Rothia aeria]|uniref:ABC transporter ATP-binding protein n=1 Tax=Rothia aeria TaxID=172042 RepID=UPI00191B2B70|nr:ABC transporter ATP-binding protein [Rothia aeria]QQT89932.1 ABC transporter ATP-binding protein [Rothia aeria]